MMCVSCYEKSEGVRVVMTVGTDRVIPGSLLSSLQTVKFYHLYELPCIFMNEKRLQLLRSAS